MVLLNHSLLPNLSSLKSFILSFFTLSPRNKRAKSAEYSSYLVRNSIIRVHQIKHPSFCFIKAFILCLTMTANLPCLMAPRANFLRTDYSYTEYRLSFVTGSCPKESTSANYSSCLFCSFWFLLTFIVSQGLFSVDAHLAWLYWFCCQWSTFTTSSPAGFCSRALLGSSITDPQQSSGLQSHLGYYATWITCFDLLISVKSLFESYVPPS